MVCSNTSGGAGALQIAPPAAVTITHQSKQMGLPCTLKAWLMRAAYCVVSEGEDSVPPLCEGLSHRYYTTLASRRSVTCPCCELTFAAVGLCLLEKKCHTPKQTIGQPSGSPQLNAGLKFRGIRAMRTFQISRKCLPAPSCCRFTRNHRPSNSRKTSTLGLLGGPWPGLHGPGGFCAGPLGARVPVLSPNDPQNPSQRRQRDFGKRTAQFPHDMAERNDAMWCRRGGTPVHFGGEGHCSDACWWCWGQRGQRPGQGCTTRGVAPLCNQHPPPPPPGTGITGSERNGSESQAVLGAKLTPF